MVLGNTCGNPRGCTLRLENFSLAMREASVYMRLEAFTRDARESLFYTRIACKKRLEKDKTRERERERERESGGTHGGQTTLHWRGR